MKTSEIAVGLFYHDGKLGVRQVESIAFGTVYYRTICAKSEQEYSSLEKRMVSLLGTLFRCSLASFAQWAKISVEPEASAELIADVSLKKVKLSPGEVALMATIAQEVGTDPATATVGASFSLEREEMRAAGGLQKKGLATVDEVDGYAELVLGQIGVSWLKAHPAAR